MQPDPPGPLPGSLWYRGSPAAQLSVPGTAARARPPLPLPGSRVRAFPTALVAPVPPCRLWRRLGGARDTRLRGCGQPRAGGVWGQPSLPTLFVSAGSPELSPTCSVRRRRWKRASPRSNSGSHECIAWLCSPQLEKRRARASSPACRRGASACSHGVCLIDARCGPGGAAAAPCAAAGAAAVPSQCSPAPPAPQR